MNAYVEATLQKSDDPWIGLRQATRANLDKLYAENERLKRENEELRKEIAALQRDLESYMPPKDDK